MANRFARASGAGRFQPCPGALRFSVMTNATIAEFLREMALYLDMTGVQFKPRAYERAADAVAAQGRPLSEVFAEAGVKGLTRVPGIGKGIAERIGELISTGTCR